MKHLVLILSLVLSGCLGDAFAEVAVPRATNPSETVRLTMPMIDSLATAGTVPCAKDPDKSQALLIPTDSKAIVTCVAARYVCWTQTETSFVVATATITDAGTTCGTAGTTTCPDGQGPCRFVTAGGYVTMTLTSKTFASDSQIGKRYKTCDTDTGRPCSNDNDCFDVSSDCVLTSPAVLPTGAFLCAETGGTDCVVSFVGNK